MLLNDSPTRISKRCCNIEGYALSNCSKAFYVFPLHLIINSKYNIDFIWEINTVFVSQVYFQHLLHIGQLKNDFPLSFTNIEEYRKRN